jgi:hypothetical protein
MQVRQTLREVHVEQGVTQATQTGTDWVVSGYMPETQLFRQVPLPEEMFRYG